MRPQDKVVIVLLFVAPTLGVLAVSDILPPSVALVAAALAAGCGSVLAVLRPVGTSIRSRTPEDDEAERLARVQRVRDAGEAERA